MSTLREKLKEVVRADLGMTKAELADYFKVSRQRIGELLKSEGLVVTRRRRTATKRVRVKPVISNFSIKEALKLAEAQSIPEPNTGCWIWLGSSCGNYATPSISGRQYRLSRLLLGLSVDPARPRKGDKLACHTCDQPICVNPAHLYIGTAGTNAFDRWKRTSKLKRKAA